MIGRGGRRGARLSWERTVTSPYGPIRIRYDGWPRTVAVLDGPGTPTVTALPGRLFALDGERLPAERETGRGWDPRRAARTRVVRAGGHRYELRPTGLFRARLTRDGTFVAAARGTLRAYSPFRSFPGVDAELIWTPEAGPLDTVIGQAMVLAIGAGGPGVFLRVALFWLEWFS